MLEKIFIQQHRWRMTKWMKKKRDLFPDDYNIFRIFLWLNYLGAIVGLSSIVFMILFFTGLIFHYYTLILWLVLFIGGLSIAVIGNKIQIPILHKYLSVYVKDQSISVDFNTNEWIYHQKYFSTKAYKYSLILSIVAYFPLTIIFILTLSIFLDLLVTIIFAYVLLSFLIMTNLPVLFVNNNRYYYSNVNEPLIAVYGLLTSLLLSIGFKNAWYWGIGGIIVSLYWYIFFAIWKKVIKIAENDVQDPLLSDILNYLSFEKEIVLKYWKWIQPRKYLIKEMIQSGKLKDIELFEEKIIKKI